MVVLSALFLWREYLSVLVRVSAGILFQMRLLPTVARQCHEPHLIWRSHPSPPEAMKYRVLLLPRYEDSLFTS